MSNRVSDQPSMRAAVIDRPGPPDVLRTAEVAIPAIGEDEALVRISVAGINAIDWLTRSGSGVGLSGFPTILGWDLSGTVVRTGSAVHEFGEGDEVLAMSRFPDVAGAYAEYAVVRKEELAPKPIGVDHRIAACAPMAGLTAWQSLFVHANLSAGQRVLVHSAAGGVGHVAVQLARHAGAEVIATASPTNRDRLLSLGADHVVGYDTDWAGSALGPVDVVVDPRGGTDFISLLDALRPGGVIVTLKGRQSGYDAALAERGVRVGYTRVTPDGPTLSKIARLLQRGELRIVLDRVFDLDQAARAHAFGERGHVRGKLALNVT